MKTFLSLLILIGTWGAAHANSCQTLLDTVATGGSNVLVHISAQGQAKLSQKLSKKLNVLTEYHPKTPQGLTRITDKLNKFFQNSDVKKYWKGFTPTVHISSLQMKAEIKNLKVAASFEKLIAESPTAKGVVLEAEIVLQSAQLKAQHAGLDIVAPGVGRLGLEQMSLSTLGPLTLRLPLYLNLEAGQAPEFRLLALSGLDFSKFNLQAKGLITPQIEISVDGHKLQLLQNEAIKETLERLLADQLANRSSQALAPQLLNYLNRGLATALTHLKLDRQVDLTNLQQMIGQNLGHQNLKGPLHLQLGLTQLQTQSDNSVVVGIKAEPSRAQTFSRDSKFCQISCRPHDVAVRVNTAILQSIVDQLWNNGLFSNMKLNGDSLSLLEPPQIEIYAPMPGTTSSQKLSLGLHVKPHHIQSAQNMINENFSMRIKLDMMIEPGADKQSVRIAPLGIRTEKIAFEESNLRAPFRLLAALTPNFLKPHIQNFIVNRLNTMITDGRLTRTIPLTLPEPLMEAMGLFRLNALSFDPNGQLYILLDL